MSQQTIREALDSAPVFAGMDPDHLERLAAAAAEKNVEAGTCLFRSGEKAEHFYLLLDGEISIEIPAVAGPTLTVQHLTPVRVLGWSWLLPPYKWSFNARTETDVRVLEFDGRKVLANCEADPAFGFQVIKRFSGLMAERLEAAHRKMMEQWRAPGFA